VSRKKKRLIRLNDRPELPPLPLPFEYSQREASKIGLSLRRTEKVPGSGEHWIFSRDGKCVLEYWPATLKGYIPGKGGSFFVAGHTVAIDVASTGKVPAPPCQSEQNRLRKELRPSYAAFQKRPKRKFVRLRRRRQKSTSKIAKPTKVKYHDYIVSPAWFARRRQLFDVRGERCERCGSTRNIQVHHRNYKRVGREQDKDLEVLCRGCHENEHEGKNGVVMDPITAEFISLFRG
jgi:5-methylcytosine-specific restriction endonuclease McrA